MWLGPPGMPLLPPSLLLWREMATGGLSGQELVRHENPGWCHPLHLLRS